jgi:hypothetical protein
VFALAFISQYNMAENTIVFPKKGQMTFVEQASRSNKFPIFWAADNIIRLFWT